MKIASIDSLYTNVGLVNWQRKWFANFKDFSHQKKQFSAKIDFCKIFWKLPLPQSVSCFSGINIDESKLNLREIFMQFSLTNKLFYCHLFQFCLTGETQDINFFQFSHVSTAHRMVLWIKTKSIYNFFFRQNHLSFVKNKVENNVIVQFKCIYV